MNCSQTTEKTRSCRQVQKGPNKRRVLSLYGNNLLGLLTFTFSCCIWWKCIKFLINVIENVCYFSMSLSFKLSFKKWDFWGFRLFTWKIMNIWIHICVKHRQLCYIYEIKPKNAKKGPCATEKCPICQNSFLSNWQMGVVNGPFFCIFWYNFLNVT